MEGIHFLQLEEAFRTIGSLPNVSEKAKLISEKIADQIADLVAELEAHKQ